MSDTLNIGQLITTEQHRDAIHMAVAPVTAGESLRPGQHVAFLKDTETVFSADTVDGIRDRMAVGIIDPFLERDVATGEQCWLFLYPGTITSLRHEWTHPVFEPGAAERGHATTQRMRQDTSSETWLRDFADQASITYERLMSGLDEYLKTGHWVVLGVDTPDYNREELWRHYSNITGKPVSYPDGEEGWVFSCAC